MREHLDAKKLMIPWSNQWFFPNTSGSNSILQYKVTLLFGSERFCQVYVLLTLRPKIVQRKRTPQVGAPSFLCGVTVHLARMGFRHVEEVTSWRWYVKPCTWIGTVKRTRKIVTWKSTGVHYLCCRSRCLQRRPLARGDRTRPALTSRRRERVPPSALRDL